MRRQAGFSMIELSVAIVLLGALVASVYTFLGPQLKWKSRVDTENRLAALANGLTTAYRLNAVSIDGDATARLNLGAAGIVDPVVPDGQGYCPPGDNALLPVAQWLRATPGEAMRDGYGRNFCLLIGDRIGLMFNGQTLPYHPVAIVSGGRDARVDPATALVAGQLSLAQDDVGVVVDVPGLVVAAYQITAAAMAKTASALQQYYAARYQADAARTPGTSYFGCGAASCPPAVAANRWDAGNGLPTTCSGPEDLATTVAGVIGLTREDVTDGYGRPLQFDNCGAGLRSPSNPVAAMQVPPYTAAVQTTLPDGTPLVVTALGAAY